MKVGDKVRIIPGSTDSCEMCNVNCVGMEGEIESREEGNVSLPYVVCFANGTACAYDEQELELV